MKKRIRLTRFTTLLSLILFACIVSARAQTTTFTYQGRLSDSSMAANGSYDLSFALYDAAAGGTQIGAAITRPAVTVSNGIFTVQLDFGAAAFPGANRFLEIAVKRPSDANFTTLTPRQPVTSTPYAIRAASSATANAATNAANLGGTAASQFVQTNDTRLSDARTPTAGSANYIQNTTTQQTADFNVSGTGEANIFNARTQFNFGGSRVLGVPNSTSLTVGLNAGNVLGSGNTDNTFVGSNTGVNCQTSEALGKCLGNTYLGRNAGTSQITGIDNTFIGIDTGNVSSGGNNNVIGGGSNNTLIGARATLFDNSLDHAVAIGADSVAVGSNIIVLGRRSGADTVFAPGLLNVNGGISSLSRIQADGGIALSDSDIRLRGADDSSHRILYNSIINGIEFQAFDEFRWTNIRTNAIVMKLSSTGDLAIKGNYNRFSDARYKTNVQIIANPLDSIRRLRGVTFNWIPEFNNSANQIGFIAQEVEQVLPELVHTDKEGFKSVAYSDAVPVLVEAVKEQQTQIETQNQKIEQQQKQIDDLKLIVCSIKPDAEVCSDKK